jgi:hypothetical protein
MIKVEMNAPEFSFTDVTKENFPYVDKCLKNSLAECSNLIFFPKGELNIKVNDISLRELMYLASFTEDKKKCPFTEHQKTILKSAYFWNVTTKWSLRVSLVIITGIITALVIVPAFTNDSNNSTASNETTSQGATPYTNGIISYAIIAGVIANMFSFWATGFSPNYFSNASNRAQDVLVGVNVKYNNLSARLIRLYCDEKGKEEAKKIAGNLMSNFITEKCLQYTQNTERTNHIMSELRQAAQYITSNEQIIPESFALINTIEVMKKSK